MPGDASPDLPSAAADDDASPDLHYEATTTLSSLFTGCQNWRRELRQSKQPKDMAITQHSKNRRIKGDVLLVLHFMYVPHLSAPIIMLPKKLKSCVRLSHVRTKETKDKEGRPILVLPPTDIQVIECEQSEAEHSFYDALYKKSLPGSGKKFSS
nr:DNA repair protein RAD5B [Ipomoea batatas]